MFDIHVAYSNDWDRLLVKIALAMLRVNTRLSLPKRSAVTLLFGKETQMASRVARRVKVVCASLPQLSYLLTARGTHTQPSPWHLGSLAVCLCCSLAAAAAPAVIPASFSTAGVSGEATVTSYAAGLPLSKSATKTSAGRVCLRSGVNQLPTSTLTPRRALWQKSTITFCNR